MAFRQYPSAYRRGEGETIFITQIRHFSIDARARGARCVDAGGLFRAA